MINLRSTTPSSQSTQSDRHGANRSLAFASFAAHDSILGNIGQPMGDDLEWEDDGEEPPRTENPDGASARMEVNGEESHAAV